MKIYILFTYRREPNWIRKCANKEKAFGLKLTKTENQSDVILVLAMEKDVSHDFHMMFPNEMPINEPSKH